MRFVSDVNGKSARIVYVHFCPDGVCSVRDVESRCTTANPTDAVHWTMAI